MESFFKGRIHIKKNEHDDDELAAHEESSEKDALKPLPKDIEKIQEDIAIEAAENEESPKVQVISEDGSVKKIIIHCTCGKCLELECDYDEELINNLRKLKKAKR